MSSWIGPGEVRPHDRRDLRVRVADPGHPVVRTQVIEIRRVHPHERRQADNEVECQDQRGDREEALPEGHRLGHQGECHEGRRQEREEHAGAHERLVVGERPGRQQAPVLGGQERDRSRVVDRRDRHDSGLRLRALGGHRSSTSAARVTRRPSGAPRPIIRCPRKRRCPRSSRLVAPGRRRQSRTGGAWRSRRRRRRAPSTGPRGARVPRLRPPARGPGSTDQAGQRSRPAAPGG